MTQQNSPLKIELAPEYASVLKFENYPTAPQIEGVWVQALKKNRSENGAFMEYLRLDEHGVQGLPGQLVPRQISVSWAAPGRINIPSGVAHGYQASQQGATLIYTMDAQFDLADPNEGRLPWNHFGDDLWAEDMG